VRKSFKGSFQRAPIFAITIDVAGSIHAGTLIAYQAVLRADDRVAPASLLVVEDKGVLDDTGQKSPKPARLVSGFFCFAVLFIAESI